MTFKIVRIKGRHQVQLDGEPSWVRGLTSGDGPDTIADEAAIVVAFSIWSTPDRENAYHAIDVARDENIPTSVYLLPFDFPEELAAWNTDLEKSPSELGLSSSNEQGSVKVFVSPNPESSPVWMVLRSGSVIETHQGKLATDSLRMLLRAALTE